MILVIPIIVEEPNLIQAEELLEASNEFYADSGSFYARHYQALVKNSTYLEVDIRSGT